MRKKVDPINQSNCSRSCSRRGSGAVFAKLVCDDLSMKMRKAKLKRKDSPMRHVGQSVLYGGRIGTRGAS